MTIFYFAQYTRCLGIGLDCTGGRGAHQSSILVLVTDADAPLHQPAK